MSEEIKERRCLICKKKLIDCKSPICPRCTLTGTNGVKKFGGWVIGGTVAVGVGAKALADIFSKSNDDQEQDKGDA